jgi:hypothetical protein
MPRVRRSRLLSHVESTHGTRSRGMPRPSIVRVFQTSMRHGAAAETTHALTGHNGREPLAPRTVDSGLDEIPDHDTGKGHVSRRCDQMFEAMRCSR